ncbi:hypothetical protein NVP1174O_15 [Vibrio phage 1.174.O._10N.261.55.A8]|nr:hypothetical protein NVP1174O_15 [Vibrio phage 1.174.O._10N.261.55.A8]
MEIKWEEVGPSSPAYGSAVLLKINGTIQKITYCRDGSDDSEDWFEPYGNHVDGDLKGELSFFVDCESCIQFAYIGVPD